MGQKILTESDLNAYRDLQVEIKDLEERLQKEQNPAIKNLYDKRKKCSCKKKEEIEFAIDGIKEARLRNIFRARYIDGLTCEQIGDKYWYTRASISRIIKNNLPLRLED